MFLSLNKAFIKTVVCAILANMVSFISALACFDETKELENEIDKCAVVLVAGLKTQDQSGAEKTLNFLEPVILEQIFGNKALIRREDGFRGTTNVKFLKIYQRAGYDFLAERVRVDDISDPADEQRANNPLEAKVVVANTIERLEHIRSGNEAVNVISMRDRPDNQAMELAKLDIFNILTIHAANINQGQYWYFVGRRGLEFSNWRKTLMGWVRDTDVILWPQRQAVYPRLDTKGIVFSDSALSMRQLRVNIQNDADPNRRFVVGKMPLLSSPSLEAFEVVVAAERIGSNGSNANGSTDDIRQRLWRLLANIDKREVLFVIDNTESMARYRRPVINGIMKFATASGDVDKTRYAFAFFGDKFRNNDIDKDASIRTWGQERGKWNSRISGEMRKRKVFFQFALREFGRFGELPSTDDLNQFFGGTYSDPQRDKPEMGLTALDLAVKVVNWQHSNTVRVVVYIGDDADRLGSVTQVAETLADKNVTLIALNVKGSNVNDEYNKHWLQDVTALKTAVEAHGHATEANIYPPIKTYGQGREDELTATQNLLADNLLALFVIGSELGSLNPRDFISSGDAVANVVTRIESRLAKLNVASGTFFDDFLAAHGLQSAEAVAQFYANNDTVSIGYLPQKESNLYIAMTRRELTTVYRAMVGVCSGMADSADVDRTMRDVAVDLAVTFLGEELQGNRFVDGRDGETIGQFFRRIMWLPAEYFSVFGDRTVPQFIRYVKNEAKTEEYKAVHKEVCFSARLLQTIIDGEYGARSLFRYDGIDSRFNEPVFSVNKTLKKFDWVWGPREQQQDAEKTIQASSFYFVPQDFFPQDVTKAN